MPCLTTNQALDDSPRCPRCPRSPRTALLQMATSPAPLPSDASIRPPHAAPATPNEQYSSSRPKTRRGDGHTYPSIRPRARSCGEFGPAGARLARKAALASDVGSCVGEGHGGADDGDNLSQPRQYICSLQTPPAVEDDIFDFLSRFWTLPFPASFIATFCTA